MENEEENIFRSFIEKAEPEKPSADFTNLVMKMVEVEIAQELLSEGALSNMLQRGMLTEKPSASFTRMVMDQAVTPLRKPEAIISRRSWYMIAALLLLTVIFCIFAFAPETEKHVASGMDIALTGFSGKLDQLPVIYPLTIFAMSVLLFADYLFKYGKARQTNWI